MGNPIIAYQTTYPVKAFLEKLNYLLSIYLQRNKKPRRKHSKISHTSDPQPYQLLSLYYFLMLINLLEMKVLYMYIYATYTNDF